MVASAKKKKPNRRGRPLNVWLDVALREALDRASKHERRKIREEVAMALEARLRKIGFWPPNGE